LYYSNSVVTFLISVYVFTTNVNAQQSVPESTQRCERILSDMGARLAIPSFNSPAIREAVCICVKADPTFRGNRVSESSATESMQSVVAQCASRAVPAEKLTALPVAVLVNLQDAMNSIDAPKGFVNAKANFSACKRPEYPQASLRVEATGDTLLAFKISDSGRVLDGVVIRSAGASAAHKLLDVTALFSLMQCKFEPAYWRSKGIETWTEVEYRWLIN